MRQSSRQAAAVAVSTIDLTGNQRMPRMTGGEAIVDGLIRHGIDTIFGLPGVQTYGLFDALARNANRIRLINARHEQTTAYMALGYACATGKPSAYSVVPGPGVMNTAAALVTAWGVNAPVLCVTGQVPGAMIGRQRGQLHEMKDQLTTMRTLVKHADRIDHPSEAPVKVARAFQEMLSGRRGPASIEMPWEQFASVAEVTPMDPMPLFPNPTPDPERIAALAKLVDAAAEILALAEKIGAPVVSFRGGRGIVADSHPLGLAVPSGLTLWPGTDLLIGIGTRLDVPVGRWGGIPAGMKVARIDIDGSEMHRVRVDVPIVADAADAARALTDAVQHRSDPARAEVIAKAKADAWASLRSVQPQMAYLEVIRDVLPANGILCDEMTQVGYVSWFGFPLHEPRTLITSGFSGTLGAGFPTALGVKVGQPNRPVVAVTGDGGFLFGGSDLATAVRHGINLVTILFNNEAYGNVLRDQRRLFEGRESGSALSNPDFQLYAKAFGVRSWRVDDADGLRGALTEALTENAPTLIEVMTDITRESSPWEVIFPGRA
jgi:acetolactate synthase-1/2/3 large subunit